MSRQNSPQEEQKVRHYVAIVASLLLAIGCGKKAEDKKEEARTPPPAARDAQSAAQPAPPDAGLKDHMQVHFEAIRSIERALVIGDLETAKVQAGYLANHKMSEEVKGYEPEARAVQEAARAFVDSATAESAPLAAARLAASCGECHLVTTAITSYEWNPLPEDQNDAKSRMQRHLWAMDRLWEGLVSPSDTLWGYGADVLAGGPFPVDLVKDKVPAEKLKELTAIFDATAKQAKAASTQEERAAVYGRLLGTCASCHKIKR
jgi:hypothetical protein